MKPPVIREVVDDSQVPNRGIGSTGFISPMSITSFNHLSGVVNAEVFQYPNEWSYSWYTPYTKFRVTGVGLTVTGRNGNVRDMIVPGAGRGQIIEGTTFTLEHAGKEVAGCMTATLRVTRELYVSPRESITLMVSNPDGELKRVFTGFVESPPINYKVRTADGHQDVFEYSLLGYKAFEEDVRILSRSFVGVDIGEAIRVIAYEELSMKTPIQFRTNRVPYVGYILDRQDFVNVSALSALDTLVQMAGDYVHGVDADGVFYFQPKDETPVEHYWLGQHPVRLLDLKLDTTQIKNYIYVQSPVVEGQPPTYTVVYDQPSIDLWGKVEEVIPFPSTRLSTENVAISSIVGSNTIEDIDGVYDGNPTTFATMETDLSDFIEVEYNQSIAISGIILTQGDGYGNHYVQDIDLYDGSELIHEYRAAYEYGSMNFSTRVTNSLRLVARSVPTDSEWHIRSLQLIKVELSDALRYGEAYISAVKDPIWSGQIELEPGIFQLPLPMRVTDQMGVTRYFDSSQTTYTFQPHLQAVVDIGKGQIEIGKVLNLKARTEALPDSGSSGTTTNASQPVTGVVNTPGAGDQLVDTTPNGTVLVKRLTAGLGVAITDTGDALRIDGSKPLEAGPGITVEEGQYTTRVSATLAGADNVGSITAAGIYKTSTLGILLFKSLVAGDGVTITAGTNEITIAAIPVEQAVQSVAGKTGVITLEPGDVNNLTEYVQDTVATMLSDGTDLAGTYDDALGKYTFNVNKLGGRYLPSSPGVVGQVLAIQGPTQLVWQTPASGGGSGITYREMAVEFNDLSSGDRGQINLPTMSWPSALKSLEFNDGTVGIAVDIAFYQSPADRTLDSDRLINSSDELPTVSLVSNKRVNVKQYRTSINRNKISGEGYGLNDEYAYISVVNRNPSSHDVTMTLKVEDL